MTSNSNATRGTCFQSAIACDLNRVRPMSAELSAFLAEEGFRENEISACELALSEACNNAIQHATETGKNLPVEISAVCNPSSVELRITDHTAGFRLPEESELPDVESESGRGLFLMRSLMDEVSYFRGEDKNTLLLRLQKDSPGKPRQNELEQTIREMAKELCFRSESLAAIFRCSAELGHAHSVENFSEGLLHDLLDIVFADWFVLRIVRKKTGHLSVLAASEPSIVLDAISLAEAPGSSVEAKAAVNHVEVAFNGFEPLSPDDPLAEAVGQDAHGLTLPLFMGKTLIGTLTVGKSESMQMPFTPIQLQVVRTFADYLAIQIVNAKFQEEALAGKLVAREMEIAKNIQRALLPRSLPSLKNFALAGFCQSAREVGGDFYDVIALSPDTALLIVADVMGKGVPAAMFAAIFAATVRGLVLANPEAARQPAQLLAQVNRQMIDELSEVDMFITAQLVFLDIARREIIAASAGHCPLFIGRAGGGEVISVSPEGMPLGILRDTPFTDAMVKLQDDCRILLYTDGLTEARDEHGEFYGQERLRLWFQNSLQRAQTANQLKQQLLVESNQFKSDYAQPDDQTFLILAEG